MDQSLLFWINQQWANPLLDIYFQWVSSKFAFSIPALIIVAVTLTVLYKGNGLKLTLLMFLVLAIADTSGNTLKKTLKHPRPCQEMADQVRAVGQYSRCLKSYGMPSNHALNFFAVAIFLGVILRKFWLQTGLLVIAISAAISRVYLGVHYPSQVGTGILLGVLLGGLASYLTIRYWPFAKQF